ncbi:choline trimethylamine-lyase [Enterobacter cloacae]|uniref:choline trimethylamine-lyase n=1 Tax=Enterobacter cloacae TaxID=550 RepID=UPI00079B215A|nr:choline trimethylamine-lyase [Enterobacter cloacae]CZW62736.1 Pyruvate formate-lyase [Enterobacter cloacae]
MNTEHLSLRVIQLRDKYLQAKPFISAHRAVSVTEVYKENPGMDNTLLRALAFRRACEKAPLYVADNELIVSHPAGGARGGEVSPEISWRWVAGELDNLPHRAQDPYQIDDETRRLLREEVFPYWEGRSLDEMAQTRLTTLGLWEWCHDDGICDVTIKTQNGGGDSCPGYDTLLLGKGIKGIRDEASARLAALDATTPDYSDAFNFYTAMLHTCDGVVTYAQRYSRYLAQLAETENDPLRRDELLQLADICRHVPEHPPRHFHDALQAIWFVHSLFMLEENQTGISLGRVDQYLWPLLARDLNNGTLTRQQAEELLCCWMIKMAETLWICSEPTAMYFAGYQPFINLVVGGQKREGGDATNPLTLMIMDCSAQLKIYQPGLAVRIHNQSPQPFMRKVVDVVRSGMGFPACHFDDAHIRMMLHKGFSYEDARDYCLMGCVEPQKSGKMYQWTSVGYTTFTAAIELALRNGHNRAGKPCGPATGVVTQFTTYEEVEQAVRDQLSAIVRNAAQATRVVQKLHAEHARKPLMSCFIDGCMATAKDVTQGGASLNAGPGLIWTGLADCVNSLMAIKTLVYETSRFTLPEIVEALDHNFVGYDEIQTACLRAPKYGNDILAVDEIARELVRFLEQEHRRYRMLYAPFAFGTLSISNNTPFGLITGALPSGRLAGKPLADGISPAQQTDYLGPTAIINSVSRINVEEMDIGMVHNIKLMYGMLETTEGQNSLIHLLRTASVLGNAQLQFSYVDDETLRKAQQNPADYRNLMIRVAGYSAFFVELSKEVQDEIISRTTQRSF